MKPPGRSRTYDMPSATFLIYGFRFYLDLFSRFFGYNVRSRGLKQSVFQSPDPAQPLFVSWNFRDLDGGKDMWGRTEKKAQDTFVGSRVFVL